MANKARVIAEPGKQEMFIEREFDAPRDLVFKAYTDADLYSQWIGPRNLRTNIETFEPKSGGSWRYIATDEKGQTYVFHGVNHDVTPPERVIQTFEYEELPEPGHVSLEKADFVELPGNRTKVLSHAVYLSVADRDGMLEGGMEEGLNESYDRLDELLQKMKVRGT